MIHSERSRFVRAMMTAVFTAAITASPLLAAPAPQHLVSPGQLQQSTVSASQARQQNIDEIRQFLSTPEAKKAFERAHANPEEVKKAVSGLSDQELAQLSQRATKAQRDFAGGMLGTEELILIIVAIILVILLIVYV
ncbi:MAG TPA: PA2779 family protein [Terracidiphilus sp.]|nr:PA2779 family protein [Terracidiphilus sp.]